MYKIVTICVGKKPENQTKGTQTRDKTRDNRSSNRLLEAKNQWIYDTYFKITVSIHGLLACPEKQSEVQQVEK